MAGAGASDELDTPSAGDLLVPYPTARAYLARQPDGWDSHPQCLASSELFSSLRRSGALDGLEPLVEMVKDDGSGWLSEVAIMTVLLALRDARFGTTDEGRSEESFLAWMDAVNRALVVKIETSGGPSAAPERLRETWLRLHRGTPVVVRSRSEHGALLTLQHPRGLWPDFVHEWRRRAFLASLAGHGAARPRATVRTVEDGTDYDLRW